MSSGRVISAAQEPRLHYPSSRLEGVRLGRLRTTVPSQVHDSSDARAVSGDPNRAAEALITAMYMVSHTPAK